MLFAFISTHVNAQKIIASKINVVEVDAYTFRSDELLCHGIAIEVGNSYLQSGTNLSKYAFCKQLAKSKMTFPASGCSLSRVTQQCVDEINNPTNKKANK